MPTAEADSDVTTKLSSLERERYPLRRRDCLLIPAVRAACRAAAENELGKKRVGKSGEDIVMRVGDHGKSARAEVSRRKAGFGGSRPTRPLYLMVALSSSEASSEQSTEGEQRV